MKCRPSIHGGAQPPQRSEGWQGMEERFSRRLFLGGVVGAVGLGIIGCDALSQTPQPVQFHPDYVTYHNRSAAYHQQQINNLSRQGYRPISLSLYGDPEQPRYAAVWLKRGGNAWYTFHTVRAAEYESLYTTWTRRGYRPTVLTATGLKATAVFAGVFEKDATPFLVRYHLVTNFQDDIIDTPPTEATTVQYWQNWAMNNTYILRWGAIYGNDAEPLYAGIWEKNPGNISWNWFSAFYEASDLFQQRLRAEAAQWIRPSFITLSSNHHAWSTFRDDVIGPWKASNNLTTNQYETQVASSTREGYYPLLVQGGGTGTDTRFAAIFVKQAQPASRRWTVTGKTIPVLAAFDTIMQRFMQQHAIRGGSLAIARQGRLILTRAYTWAEADYPITQPTSLFRTASCTKPFTSIAIHQLIERGLLTLDTPIQEILHLTTADGHAPRDPRFGEIRVWHLLSHAGGWDRRVTFDPLFDDATIAQTLGVPLPITKYQMTTYMADQPLQFTPGTKAVYSNFGYSLLGQIIEKLTGQSYERAMGQSIYAPLGLARPRLGQSLLSQRMSGEVRYHGRYPFIAQSVMSPDQPIVPAPYGGTNEQLGDSLGDLIMATCDYVRMLAAFDLEENNPLLHPATVATMWTEPVALAGSNILRGWFKGTSTNGLSVIGHNGDELGSTTMAFRRSDALSFVVFFNHDFGMSLYIDGPGNVLSNALSEAADAISDWPGIDLFPYVDIPAIQ